jgi:hypothetical protein
MKFSYHTQVSSLAYRKSSLKEINAAKKKVLDKNSFWGCTSARFWDDF